MGCGCVVLQDLVRIDQAIKDRSLFSNAVLLAAMRAAKANNRAIHLLGLVSDGGVHSHIRHLLALLEMAQREGCMPIVHAIMDGRDTAPRCAARFLHQLQAPLQQAGGAIATLMGRYYAMDRDARWERTAAAWRAIAQRDGEAAARLCCRAQRRVYRADLRRRPRAAGRPRPDYSFQLQKRPPAAANPSSSFRIL